MPQTSVTDVSTKRAQNVYVVGTDEGAGSNGIETVTLTVTTTGAAGSATGTATSAALEGFLLDVYVDYGAAPATTDLLLLYESPSNGQILSLANRNTDGIFAPRYALSDSSGAAITGLYDLYPLNGTVTVQISQSDALTGAAVVRLRYLKVG